MAAISHPSGPPSKVGSPSPIYVRVPRKGVCPYTGLGRGKIYELINKNVVRSSLVRSPGRKHGTRIYHLPSLLAYIESQATGPAAPAAAVVPTSAAAVDSLPE